jgi:hypothetical protein
VRELNTLLKQLRLLVLPLLLVVGLVVPGVALSATATVGMPFTGQWAYNVNVNPPYTDSNSSHPSVHANYYGDWSTDIYAAEGAAVKLHVSSPDGALSFYWISRADGACGHRTVIGVRVNGVDVGSVYYEHLANAVTSGTITNGMTVGNVHNWGRCNPGPHVHVELKNVSNYACWVDNGRPGVTVNEEDPIGVIGSSNTGAKQACSGVPGGGNSSNPHDPAIVQRTNGETDVVAVGPSNSLDFYFNALNSSYWNKLSIASAGTAYSSPIVVQRPNGETNVVVASSNSSLDYYMNALGSPTWGKLTIAGANAATSDPAVIQRRDSGGNVIETDVVSTSSDGSANYYYNGTGSPTWGKIPITIPNAAGSSPAVVQRSNGETDVVIREADGALGYYFNAPGSGGWGRLTIAGSSSAISSPAVVQRPSGETDVVVLGQNNSLDYYFNAVGSPNWGKLTIDGVNSAYSRPAIIQRRDSGGNVIETDVVVVGLDHRLSYYFNATGSSTWGKLTIAGAGAAFSSPAVVQRPNGETDVVVVGPSNSLDYYFNSSGSSTWSRLSIAGPNSAY